MSFDPQARVTHRSVLTVAVPIMLSNVSEPLIGVVNTAVIGQLKEPYYIGAIAVGALIFSFIFWGFGFLRMSTGGLSAQAMGGNDRTELVAVLIRALMIALAAGLALVLLSPLIRQAAFDLVGGSPKRGRAGFDELAQARGLDVVTFRDWQKIEQAEQAAARDGSPREKFTDIASMIAARTP